MSDGSMRIGIVSARLAGTDGVSLEAGKWVQVLKRMGHECFYFCGSTDWDDGHAFLVDEASFSHEDVWHINETLFQRKERTAELGKQIQSLKDHLKERLAAFVDAFGIECFVVENALSLPMNLPLGLAIAEYIAEHDMPTIGHHHDFWWERERYVGGPAGDYLRSAFPATHRTIRHVVINSVAERRLAFRTGASTLLIPNVMDFDNPPGSSDDYANDMRKELGIDPDVKVILQPTRIVPRKRIEKAVELVRRLDADCVLLVTHNAGDEGHEYVRYLRRFADMLGVDLLMPAERFDIRRGTSPDGDKVYSLDDAYRAADLVTYCSLLEGFGNAFLETIYYKRPMIMSAYEIFSLDIEPKGFEVLAFHEFISDRMVKRVDKWLADPDAAAACAEHNFELGRKYYSLKSLENKLHNLLVQCVGIC